MDLDQYNSQIVAPQRFRTCGLPECNSQTEYFFHTGKTEFHYQGNEITKFMIWSKRRAKENKSSKKS